LDWELFAEEWMRRLPGIGLWLSGACAGYWMGYAYEAVYGKRFFRKGRRAYRDAIARLEQAIAMNEESVRETERAQRMIDGARALYREAQIGGE